MRQGLIHLLFRLRDSPAPGSPSFLVFFLSFSGMTGPARRNSWLDSAPPLPTSVPSPSPTDSARLLRSLGEGKGDKKRWGTLEDSPQKQLPFIPFSSPPPPQRASLSQSHPSSACGDPEAAFCGNLGSESLTSRSPLRFPSSPSLSCCYFLQGPPPSVSSQPILSLQINLSLSFLFSLWPDICQSSLVGSCNLAIPATYGHGIALGFWGPHNYSGLRALSSLVSAMP